MAAKVQIVCPNKTTHRVYSDPVEAKIAFFEAVTDKLGCTVSITPVTRGNLRGSRNIKKTRKRRG